MLPSVAFKLPLGRVGVSPVPPNPGTHGPLPCCLAPAAEVQNWGTRLPFVAPRGLQRPAHPLSVCLLQGPGASPPQPWLLPSALLADCSQPLDVVLLLDGSSSFPASYFDEMKSFAKVFMSRANIGE